MKQDLRRDNRASNAQARRGSTIVEAVLITAVVGLVLVTIVSVLVLVVRNQRFSADQQTATRYAEESLEWLHKQRDQAGWNGFFESVGANTYCLASLPTTLADLSAPADCDPISASPIFTRTMQLTLDAATPQKVTARSTVSWTDNGKSFSVVLTLVLKEWQ